MTKLNLTTANINAVHSLHRIPRRLTIKNVNAMIAALGIKAELVKGRGYLYFIGDDVDFAKSTSVYVYRISDYQSINMWMDELQTILDSKE